jgi:hypothetical protein
MVLSCRNDPFYNKLFRLSDDDYLLFKNFINLFYLQYDNIEKAQSRALEVLNNLIYDERTKNLAQQLINSEEIKKRNKSFGAIKKTGRIVTHLYKKYIKNTKLDLPIESTISLREIIELDWWQK